MFVPSNCSRIYDAALINLPQVTLMGTLISSDPCLIASEKNAIFPLCFQMHIIERQGIKVFR